MCGATHHRPRQSGPSRGLSPRVRGNHINGLWAPIALGPIPACAGQPSTRNKHGASVRAYPRVCGATLSLPKKAKAKAGLSPRVRGNLRSSRSVSAWSRPIPACAGQPSSATTTVEQGRAYPRVCGATLSGRGMPQAVTGLSPRVRGNHGNQTRAKSNAGPIPACAGQPL